MKLFGDFLISKGLKINLKQIYCVFGVEKHYYAIGGIKTLRQIEKETADKWWGFQFGSDESILSKFTFDVDKNTLYLEINIYLS